MLEKSSNINGEFVYIVYGKRHSVLNFGNSIVKILPKKLESYHTIRSTGDVRYTVADISLTMRLLGYEIKGRFHGRFD